MHQRLSGFVVAEAALTLVDLPYGAGGALPKSEFCADQFGLRRNLGLIGVIRMDRFD
jgi:hypothetical protein